MRLQPIRKLSICAEHGGSLSMWACDHEGLWHGMCRKGAVYSSSSRIGHVLWLCTLSISHLSSLASCGGCQHHRSAAWPLLGLAMGLLQRRLQP